MLDRGTAHVEADKNHVGHDKRNQCIFQKEVGPARTAILPSHGSANPTKDQNMDDAITKAAAPAMPDFRSAFLNLEDRIAMLQRAVNSTAWMVEDLEDGPRNRVDMLIVSQERYEALATLASTARREVRELDQQWTETHNAFCDADWAEAGRP